MSNTETTSFEKIVFGVAFLLIGMPTLVLLAVGTWKWWCFKWSIMFGG